MNIIISGGRGFIGTQMVPALIAAGHVVTVWSRTPQEEKRAGVGAYYWNPVEGPPQPESLEKIDVVIHMAGESVAQKWNPEVKARIRESRVIGTRNLVAGIEKMLDRPKALVCSSATGFYGDRDDEVLTEESAPGSGFLSDVCQEWEKEADQAAQLGLRVVKIRTGMVVGAGGGAVNRLIPTFKAKMGGKLGSGKQWMPWIHMRDIVGIYQFAAERDVFGVLNGTAPNPVRNEEFTEAFGSALEEPWKLQVPEFALKMMFGEMADVVLSSQRVLPEATLAAGYQFRFTDIHAALNDVLKAAA